VELRKELEEARAATISSTNESAIAESKAEVEKWKSEVLDYFKIMNMIES